MIASLTGILKVKAPTEVLLEVHGVGYAASIPLSTFEKLGEVGSTLTLLTYLHVREDVLQLYAFATEEERGFFRMLIAISGIGPRIAQGILSGISVAELKEHIGKENVGALTAIPGIGRKTAERIIIELRDKMSKLEVTPTSTVGLSGLQAETRNEALLALTSLGYARQIAERAIRQALSEANGASLSLQELIKRSLRYRSAK